MLYSSGWAIYVRYDSGVYVSLRPRPASENARERGLSPNPMHLQVSMTET